MRIARSRYLGAAAVTGAVLALALAGCTNSTAMRAGSAPSPATPSQSSPAPSASQSPLPSAAPSRSATPSSRPSPSTSPSPSRADQATAPKPAPKPAARTPLLVEQLADVGNATQVVIVTSKGYGTTYAVLRTYEKRADGWHKVFGDMPARIGKNGFSRGTRQQGDGTTPTGKFGLGFMFGTDPRPSGVHFEYRHVTSNTIYWVGDFEGQGSQYYNTWQDTRTGVKFDTGVSERLKSFEAYKYAQVIEFNMNPVVAGRGAAIFLHTNPHNRPTAGCVAIDTTNLLKVMRWLRPEHHPVIVMAPDSQVRKY